MGPECGFEISVELLSVACSDPGECVSHLVDDAELVWDSEFFFNGSDNGLVVVGDHHLELGAIHAAVEQIIDQRSPCIGVFAVTQQEAQNDFLALLVDGDGTEQSLLRGESRLSHGQIEGVEEEVEDGSIDRFVEPCLNVG